MKILFQTLGFLFYFVSAINAAEIQTTLLVEKADEIIIHNVYEYLDEETESLTHIKNKTRMVDLPYQYEVNVAAKRTALSPALLHAVIATESGHRLRVISPKGAFGPMQLMPATARSLKVWPHDPAAKQILAGATYLKELIIRFEGDLSLALAAYNAGPATVEKYKNHIPPYVETQQYVRKVYGHLNNFTYLH